MTYEYKRTEENLWTVGTCSGSGVWAPESDHGSPEEAAERARYLNGGNTTVPQSEIVSELREALKTLLIEAKQLGEGEGCDHSVGICWCSYFSAVERAEAALHKAEGETQ